MIRVLVVIALAGALVSLVSVCSTGTYAQSAECWPDLAKVADSMRDVTAIRKAEEEQVRLLRELVRAHGGRK